MHEKKAPKGTVRKLWKFLKAHRFALIVSAAFTAANVALTLYIPLVFGQTIDLIAGKGSVDLENVAGKLWLSVALIAGAALCAWIFSVLNNRVTNYVVRDLRDAAFRRLNVLPLRFLDTHPTGETLGKIVSDVEQFSDGLLLGFSQFLSGVLTIGGTLVLLLRISPMIALAVALLTPLSLFAARFITRRTYKYFSRQLAVRSDLTGMIEETTGNLKTVKAFAREKCQRAQFDEMNGKLARASLKAVFLSSTTNPVTRFVNALVYAAVALIGTFSVLGILPGGMTVGLLATALSFANQYTKPFNEISSVFAELQGALACAARVIALIEEPAETPDAPDAVELTAPAGDVEIRHVDFSYDPERPLIGDFNLHVKKGEKVAIVGPTGCGKTTVINLLMRFYDADRGEIKLDGVDIRDMTRRSLRLSYGMVLQETWLKNATVRENLLQGRPDASDEEMIAAAKRTHAHSFIKRLPQKYDTVLGEDGGSLSQGQKQLLCITRAMIAEPQLLILDEATSSIDLATEIRVQRAFDALTEGKTCFIVAHRLSTVMNADVIVVMDAGHIVEQGTHEELLAKDGFYASLWKARTA